MSPPGVQPFLVFPNAVYIGLMAHQPDEQQATTACTVSQVPHMDVWLVGPIRVVCAPPADRVLSVGLRDGAN